jgi:hypothetical protein
MGDPGPVELLIFLEIELKDIIGFGKTISVPHLFMMTNCFDIAIG